MALLVLPPRAENVPGSLARAIRPARDPLPRLIEIVIVALACWTVFCHLLVFAGASFTSLLRWSFFPVVVAAALAAILRRGTPEKPLLSPDEAAPPPDVARVSTRLGVAAVIVLAYWLTQSYPLFWFASLLYVAAIVVRERHAEDGSVAQRAGRQSVPAAWILVAALGGALLTLVSHRPDWDDAIYVELAAGTQVETDKALLGPEVAPAPYYRVHTYEPMVATLASVTGLQVPFVYYVVLPTLMGFLVVIVQFLALRELNAGRILGFAMVLVALVSWGDEHQCFGNFAFVRLFQGKAIVVSFFVPAILYCVARYLRAPSARNWTLLALTQVAAVGFSSNALVVAPLSATVFFLASLRGAGTRVKHISLGLLASGYSVLLLLVASSSYGWDRASATASSGLIQAMTAWRAAAMPDADAGLHVVLGHGIRGYLALFALLGLAAAPIRPAARLSGSRLALAFLVIPLNPLVGQLLKPFAECMTWRIFWTVPFPLMLGLFVASLAIPLRSTNWSSVGKAASAAICLAFALAPGNWTTSGDNGTRIAFPDYKVDATYWVAGTAIRITEPGGLILAPESVAVWIPTFSNAPGAVATRRMYMDWLPENERSIRMQMFDLVEGAPLAPAEVRSVLREIMQRRVTTVVVSGIAPATAAIRQVLGRHGYSERATAGDRLFVLDGGPLLLGTSAASEESSPYNTEGRSP